MKKFFIVLLASALFFMSCISTEVEVEAPELPNSSCYLIDLKTIGYPEDYVKFHNCTSEPVIDIRVFVYNQSATKWEMFGMASLNGLDDIDTIFNGPFNNNSLEDYRFVAIQFRTGENYDFTTSNIRDDLHIYLFDEGDDW